MNDPRYRSSFGFIDLLFNPYRICFLFMLAFMLINPVAKKKQLNLKQNTYNIRMGW